MSALKDSSVCPVFQRMSGISVYVRTKRQKRKCNALAFKQAVSEII
jgi:hypothetical protein